MKLKYVAILLATILVATVAAWAVNEYFITSPHVIVEVEEYAITFEANSTRITLGETILFTGTYTYANNTGTYYIGGETVTLWYNTTNTGFTDVTDDFGYYEIPFTPIAVGTYDFYANATVS